MDYHLEDTMSAWKKDIWLVLDLNTQAKLLWVTMACTYAYKINWKAPNEEQAIPDTKFC